MDNNDNNRCPQQRAFSYLALNAKNVKKKYIRGYDNNDERATLRTITTNICNKQLPHIMF